MMPDLTPDEQAVVGLLEQEGPKTQDEIVALWVIDCGEPEPDVDVAGIARDLLARDMLLWREKIVECPACKGSRERPSGEPWPCDIELCDECLEDEDGQPTGSVKVRVIGVRCRENCNNGVELVTWDTGLAPYPEACSCSSTPTPGLDPGSEGTPIYRVGMVPPCPPSPDDDPADQEFDPSYKGAGSEGDR